MPLLQNWKASVSRGRTRRRQKRRRVSTARVRSSWSPDLQPYGVRCRALGGSTHAWAGKSAAFDSIDFDEAILDSSFRLADRRASLAPYLDRAADVLNLGPNCYDDGLWELIGRAPPEPRVDVEGLRSFFWQFARSRLDHLDIMRFGREFVTFKS